MGVKFYIKADEIDSEPVAKIRKILDPLAKNPPTVGKNDRFPGMVFFDYDEPLDEAKLLVTALSNGGGSASHYSFKSVL